MASTLLEHWNETLDAMRAGEFPPEERDRLHAKILRYLIVFYWDEADQVRFPPQLPLPPDVRLEQPPGVTGPKSPEMIRSLLRQISDAVAGSQAAGWM